MLDAAPDTAIQPEVAPAWHNHHRCGSHPAWAVVQTQPQAERWADANLRRQGYVTYLPLCAVRVRDRAIRSLWHTVERPLFTSYLFVQPGTHWAPIAHTFGVRRLLLAGQRPDMVRAGAVEALQAAQGVRAIPLLPGALWRPGAPCRLADGAFAGRDAVVVSVKGDRVTVSLICLGALRNVVVPADWLERRDE